MIKTTHLRARLGPVLTALEERLGSEGLIRAPAPPPRVVEFPDGRTMTLGPEIPRGMRCVLLVETAGWVTIADDPFAATDWGALLSSVEEAPVFTLEGEADHAFYSTIVVHERGEVAHRSQVPDDAVLEEDGRHRIRPRFLAAYFPEAAAAIDAGIVVNRLGGEENVHAVAEVLGLPNGLLSPDSDGVTVHYFVIDPARAPERGPNVSGLSGLLGKLAAEAGVDLAALGFSDPEALVASFGEPTAMPLELHAPLSGSSVGFLGDAFQTHTTFRIAGGGGASAAGLSMRVRGAGVFDVTEVRVRGSGGTELTADLEVEGHDRVARLPSVVFTQTADADRKGRFDDPAEVVVYLSGTLVAVGEVQVEIASETTADDGTRLEATAHFDLTVKPAPRVPLLPRSVDPALLATRHFDMEAYAQRSCFCGWTAFDRPWSEVKDVAIGAATDLLRSLGDVVRDEPTVPSGDDDALCFSDEAPPAPGFRASVLRKGGESLEFAAPLEPGSDAWTRILEELTRGADVTLTAGPFRRETRIEVSHQPEGSNYFPSSDPEQIARFARVVVAWSCPRPSNERTGAAMAALGTAVLARAGNVEGHLGGVVFASGRPLLRPDFAMPYEAIVGRRGDEPRWFESHVRSPGFRVLVPAKAARRLGSPTAAIVRTPLAHGILLASGAANPFAYDAADAEAMEREVLPLLD